MKPQPKAYKGGKCGPGRRNKSGNSKPKGFNAKEEVRELYFDKPTGNPASLYFTDKELAEQNCAVSSRSILDTSRTISDTNMYYPNIIVYHMNPSVQVSPLDFSASQRKASALALSALKLRTAVAANTGRVVQYSGTDMLVLITMIGEYISMTEYGRRIFGLSYKYADLNRDIPRQLIEANGIDVDDFIKNRNSYLSEFNFLINLGSQIVIPMDKIPYLRKCRDLYQKVYTDGVEDLTCYHMFVPHSTWILDEEYETGNHLKTVNVTGEHVTSTATGFFCEKTGSEYAAGYSCVQPHAIWTFGEFIDNIYRPLVLSLLDSATFNNIYSDLRSTKFQSAYAFDFWKAELVDEHYAAPVEHDESMLSIFHNLDVIGQPIYPTPEYIDSTDPTTMVITNGNDVYSDPSTDSFIYNPVFNTAIEPVSRIKGWLAQANNAISYNWRYLRRDKKIFDFKSFNPSLDERVDAMAYAVTQKIDPVMSGIFANFKKFSQAANYNLPDHYCTGRYTKIAAYANPSYTSLSDEVAALMSQCSNHWFPLNYRNQVVEPITVSSPSANMKIWTFEDPTDTSGWEIKANPGTFRSFGIPYIDNIGIGIDNIFSYNILGLPEETTYPLAFINCNLDNFYVIDCTKHENMLNHVYQTLFTADNIIK